MLPVVVFEFDNLREERSVPLTKQSGSACLKCFEARRLDISELERQVFTLKHSRSDMLSPRWVMVGTLGVAHNPGCAHGSGSAGHHLSGVRAGKR